MKFKFLNVKAAAAQVARLVSELATITGRKVETPATPLNIVKANDLVDTLAAEVEAAKSLGGSQANRSAGQPPPVASASTPTFSLSTVHNEPVAVAKPPPISGAALREAARQFPTLDDSSRTADESELFAAVEREAFKAGLCVPGQRDADTLTAIYGSAPKPASAQARAIQTLRQTAIDSIFGKPAQPQTVEAKVAKPSPALRQPQAAPAAPAGPLNSDVLAALLDSVAGRGAAANVLQEAQSYEVGPGSLSARAAEVEHNAWQTDAVNKELARTFQARQGRNQATEAAKTGKLLSALYHLGVRHSALDFTGVEPDESRVERRPEYAAVANRRASAFLGALSGGTDICAPQDVACVQAARELIEQKHGTAFSVGMSFFSTPKAAAGKVDRNPWPWQVKA